MNENADIFLYDRVAHSVRLISTNLAGLPADSSSLQPYLSPDGSGLFFESLASDLIANDTNDSRDIFHHDIEAGPLRVGLAVIAAQTAKFVWRGEAGKTYQLQAAESLNSEWTDVGEPIVVNTSHMKAITSSIAGEGQFYRLKLLY